MTNTPPVKQETYNPRKIRHCSICNRALDPKEEYECFGSGPSSGSLHDRVWFCEEHGPQIRAALKALAS